MVIRILALFVFMSIFQSCKDDESKGDSPPAESEIAPALINGKPVEPGTFKDVVRIQTGSAGCSATVVGPKVVVTAAHCGGEGATSQFKLNGKTYSGKIDRSAIYPRQDHDVAVIITTQEIPENEVGKYAIVKGTVQVGTEVTLLGYGCTRPGGGGGNDGVLRIGQTKVTGFSGYDFVSSSPGGAALCFGDSGGPAFIFEGDKHYLVGVNSKGNIRNTNYNAYLASSTSKDFFTEMAKKHSVEICGINRDCGASPGPSPDPEPEPKCSNEKKKELLKDLTMCLDVSTF